MPIYCRPPSASWFPGVSSRVPAGSMTCRRITMITISRVGGVEDAHTLHRRRPLPTSSSHTSAWPLPHWTVRGPYSLYSSETKRGIRPERNLPNQRRHHTHGTPAISPDLHLFLSLGNAVYADRQYCRTHRRMNSLKPSETSPLKERRRRIARAFHYGGPVTVIFRIRLGSLLW